MWLTKSTLYQIYPLGFCDAPLENDGKLVSRFKKVAEWGPHLEKLDIDAVLFNPFFESDKHGYDTRDFLKVDCRLGTNKDVADVIKTLHEHKVNIILDAVFNHVGRGFWAFRDVQEKREGSAYKDWFLINFGGNNDYNDGFWYEGWEGHFELVKLNLKNPEVVSYLLDCVTKWVDDFDIDGLRLDVAYSLDHDFLRALRKHCDSFKKDFVLIGEVLFGDYNVIVNPEMLQSCTNYECYKGIYSSFNSMNMYEISYSLNRQYGKEDWCLYRGKQLMVFLDNHDVTRIASILTNPNHLPLAYALLFGMPGIPCIYYGSEWGALGEKNQASDAPLRPAFAKPEFNELTKYIQQLIHLRHSTEALNIGSYENVVVTNPGLIFKRESEQETIYVAINANDQDGSAEHGALYGNFKDLLTDKKVTLSGQLKMPAYSAQFLKSLP